MRTREPCVNTEPGLRHTQDHGFAPPRTDVDEITTIARLGLGPDRRTEREKSAGGIIIPDSAQEKPEEGEVLAVGAGHFVEDKDLRTRSRRRPL